MKNNFNFFYIIIYFFVFSKIYSQINETRKEDQVANKIEWAAMSQKQYSVKDTRFNWFERNKKRKEAYLIYNGIMSIVEAFKNVVNIFEDRSSQIEKAIVEFNSGVLIAMKSILPSFLSIENLNILIDEYKEGLKKISESELINREKDFKKDYAKLNQDIDDFEILANQHINNFNLINQSIVQIKDSLKILNEQVQRMQNFEKLSWENYQKLDELISDDNASESLNIIKNAQENINVIASYIKNDFVIFFNKKLSDISNAINTFNSQIKQWTEESFILKNRITNLHQRDENEKILIKNKDEQESRKQIEQKKKEIEIKQKKELENRAWYIKTTDLIINLFNNIVEKIKLLFFKNNKIDNKLDKNLIDSSQNVKQINLQTGNTLIPNQIIQSKEILTQSEQEISQNISNDLKNSNVPVIDMKYNAVYKPEEKKNIIKEKNEKIRNTSEGNLESVINKPIVPSGEANTGYVPALTNYTESVEATEALIPSEIPEIKIEPEEKKEIFKQEILETPVASQEGTSEDPFAKLKDWNYNPSK